MNFETSSQRARWHFTPEQLLKIRTEKRKQSLDAIKQAAVQSSDNHAGTGSSDKGKLHAVKLDEAQKLLKYYSSKIHEACARFRLPKKVAGAAIMFLQRIYLHFSILDRNPADLFICCIYIACKVEEHYMSAESLAQGVAGMEEQDLLLNEPALLDALHFDLITYPPYRAIDGFIQDLRDSQAESRWGALLALSREQLQQARDLAVQAADALLLTDAPLLFPPAQLALAALRSALRKVGMSFAPYLEHAAQQCCQNSAGLAKGRGSEAAAYLRAQLDAVDKYGAEGAAKVDEKELRRIDRKLKQCRNLALDPASDTYKAARAQEQQQLASQRAQKLLARKRDEEQREAVVLGWGSAEPPNASPEAHPPAKRMRPES